MSTGTGLLFARVGVKRGVAGSLSNWVGVQSARVWVMCGGSGPWASKPWFYLHQLVALSFLKTVLLLP